MRVCGLVNPGIYTEAGSRTERQRQRHRERDRERMAEGSKGRVYLRQVFPPGTDKAWGGEVLGSR